jgi:hypothetical protein
MPIAAGSRAARGRVGHPSVTERVPELVPISRIAVEPGV